MAEPRPGRRELLHRINLVSFAADDTRLFLDTHPGCQEALEFFDECQSQREKALREYARYYGPLTMDTVSAKDTGRWNWIDEPWPWQEGGC